MTHQRHPEKEWFSRQLFQPAIVLQAGSGQTELPEPTGAPIDDRFDPESLDETPELAQGRRALLKIDEMGLHPPLSEKTKCLPGIGAFLDAKNLDFHRRESTLPSPEGRQR